jgi:hypothetical protein
MGHACSKAEHGGAINSGTSRRFSLTPHFSEVTATLLFSLTVSTAFYAPGAVKPLKRFQFAVKADTPN